MTLRLLATDCQPRVVGICSRRDGEVQGFLEAALGTAEPDSQPRTRSIVFACPPERPLVGAIVAKDARPEVLCASRADGSFAVLDGEICRLDEPPATGSRNPDNDADRVLNCYSRDGIDALARLDVTGTIAIWDAAKGVFLLMRDRSGAAVSYYAERPECLLWGSEIAAVLRSDMPRCINLAALDFFLGNGFIPSPWTLLNEVRKLPPAHVLTFAANRSVDVRRYWWPTGQLKLELSRDEATHRLRDLWRRSLRRRWSPDHRIGVLLSSGIDSKLVVAGLRRLLGASVETFTFRYGSYEGPFNEGAEARRAAAHFDAPHHEIVFRPTDLSDNLDWIVRKYGEPFTYGLHSAVLGDVPEAGVSILMSGQHGMLFPSERDAWALRYRRQPALVKRCLRAALPFLRHLNATARPGLLWRVYEAAGDTADELDAVIDCASSGLPASLRGIILPQQFRDAYYSDPTWTAEARQASAALFASVANDFANESDQDKITFLHRHFRVAEGSLLWNCVWGRAYDIKIRVPFFDNEFSDFVLRLHRKSPNKPKFRHFAASLMPFDLAYTPRTSQAVPVNHWFRTELKDFLRDHLTPSQIKDFGVFNPKKIEESVVAHIRGRNDHAWKLWAVLTVLVWYRQIAFGFSDPGARGGCRRRATDKGNAG